MVFNLIDTMIYVFTPLALACINVLWALKAKRRQEWGWFWVAGLLSILGLTGAVTSVAGGQVPLKPWLGWLAVVGRSPAGIALMVWGAILLFLWKAAWCTRPEVGWLLVNIVILGVVWMGPSPDWIRRLADSETFAVSAMLCVSLFFVWYGVKQACDNDRRSKQGQGPLELELAAKVPTWPNLVYIELICILVVLTLILLWSLAFPAPLEAPANPSFTPNPAKAPWYFVGIQELLVYFDPSLAGVVLPCLLILALALLPYADINPRGNGYYTFRERPWAVGFFVFGFLGIWWFLIVLGLFFRGPGWNFLPAQVNLAGSSTEPMSRPLSELFWSIPIWKALGFGMTTGQTISEGLPPAIRELPGLLALGVYFGILPFSLARGRLRHVRAEVGTVAFWTFSLLLLLLVTVPIKMLAYWIFGISYIVAFPEIDLYF